jgi:hypothetical protein
MLTREEQAFQEHFPRFTDDEVLRFATEHSEVVSVCGRRGVPNHFHLALGTEGKAFGPFSLNQLAASELRKMLADQGF